MSRSAFFADFYAYPVASAVLIALALALEPRDWAFALGAVVLGFLLWSLVEYLLHRYVLHHIKWVKDQHDVHHRDQMALVGTPTWFSLLVFLTFVTLPMLLIASADVALGLTGGMMIGYLCYVTAHYGMHHWRIRPSSYMGGLKRRHALHHHYDDRGNFGVTSGFWDYVFRTNLRS